MVILAAIGRFFKKIWDWIKQTAWIQPLLIVGVIFGVIFSIPSIVKAVQAEKAASNEYQAYYHKFQISLELDDSSKKDSSPADKFTYSLEKVMKGGEEATAEFKKNYSNLGEKFFVAYVSESCEKCKEAKDGFKLFEESLNKDPAFKTDEKFKNDEFKMVTIFADEETSYTDDKETAFVKYLDRHQSFFEDVGSNAYQTDYYTNGKLSDSDLEYLETADPINFLTPTIFLVELGEHVTNFTGVSEVMFGVSGEDQNAKAKTLLDCWNHTGDFSVNDK